jgi:hypothetical protein
MNERDINFLKVLYNTLSLVTTKGEDTILMGECLKQLRNFTDRLLTDLQEEKNNENN